MVYIKWFKYVLNMEAVSWNAIKILLDSNTEEIMVTKLNFLPIHKHLCRLESLYLKIICVIKRISFFS